MYSNFFFSMAIIRGLGSGVGRPRLTDDEIREMITTQVTMAIREAIPKVLGSTKTAIIEMVEEIYVPITEAFVAVVTIDVAAMGVQRRGTVQYQDFSKSKPLGVQRGLQT